MQPAWRSCSPGPARRARGGFGRGVRISSGTLEDLSRAMVAAGQVTMLKVNGRTVYRAAG